MVRYGTFNGEMMNYSSKPIIMEDKDSKLIYLTLVFPFERKSSDLVTSYILKEYLSRYNFESNEESFERNLVKNNIMDYVPNIFSKGNTSYLTYDITLPNPKYVTGMNVNDSILYALASIFNPYLKSGKFSESMIDRIKKVKEDDILKQLNDIEHFSRLMADKLVLGRKYPIEILDHVQELKDVDAIKVQELYNCINSPAMVFIYGDTDSINLDMFGGKDSHYDFTALNLPSKRDFVINETQFNASQSSTSLIYSVDDLKEEDGAKLLAIHEILVCERLLNHKLRDEENLVYYSRGSINTDSGIYTLTPFTSSNNLERCEELSISVMESLKDSDIAKKYLDKIKISSEIRLIRNEETRSDAFDKFVYKHVLGNDEEERIKLLKTYEAEDITDFAKRIKPYAISRVRGESK